MQLEWEINVYPDEIMILVRGAPVCGQLIREAFPDVPSTGDYADPHGEYSYAFSLLQTAGLAERIGYLLRTLAAAQLLPCQPSRGFALDWDTLPGQAERRTTLGQLLYEYAHAERYGHAVELAHHLARFIRRHPLYQTCDFLVPVPSNDYSRPFDLKSRLGELTASLVQLPVLCNLVQRTRQTRQQCELVSPAEKLANVAGLFRCLNPSLIAGRSLLVLDDVYDSGATVGEVTGMLLAAGARSCAVLTVVRANG